MWCWNSFQVKKKQFFRNFVAIMLFGVIGVFISFAIITAGMHVVLYAEQGVPCICMIERGVFSQSESSSVLHSLFRVL